MAVTPSFARSLWQANPSNIICRHGIVCDIPSRTSLDSSPRMTSSSPPNVGGPPIPTDGPFLSRPSRNFVYSGRSNICPSYTRAFCARKVWYFRFLAPNIPHVRTGRSNNTLYRALYSLRILARTRPTSRSVRRRLRKYSIQQITPRYPW